MGNHTVYIFPFDPEVWSGKTEEDLKGIGLSIDLNDFARQLKEAWSRGDIYIVEAQNQVRWQLPEPYPNRGNSPDGGWGTLSEQCIVDLYYCPVDIMIEFALWYRKYIPLNQILFMMPEGGGGIELLQITTEEDIRDALGWKAI